jgi:hypothetical protein
VAIHLLAGLLLATQRPQAARVDIRLREALADPLPVMVDHLPAVLRRAHPRDTQRRQGVRRREDMCHPQAVLRLEVLVLQVNRHLLLARWAVLRQAVMRRQEDTPGRLVGLVLARQTVPSLGRHLRLLVALQWAVTDM